jgi:uncharacterized membrane protein YcjF (UPF0283 family)
MEIKKMKRNQRKIKITKEKTNSQKKKEFTKIMVETFSHFFLFSLMLMTVGYNIYFFSNVYQNTQSIAAYKVLLGNFVVFAVIVYSALNIKIKGKKK